MSGLMVPERETMYERILDKTKKITLALIALGLVILLISIGIIHRVTQVPALNSQPASLPEEVTSTGDMAGKEESSQAENLEMDGPGFSVIIDGKTAGQEAGQE